jgi:succinate dehydrogenase / fumarate reductase, cytochrome b subunit
LKWVVNALSTSVGKKFVMGITGLLLCGFLIVHLAGNLLLYADSDGKAYNEYAHALHENEGVLMVLEVGLFGMFAAHIALAFKTASENRAARKVRYHTQGSKIESRDSVIRPDTWMFISGVIILGFLILHLIDFKLGLRPDIDYASYKEAGKAMAILKTPLSAFVYTIGGIVLGIHLSHGISSAFQSLGLNHPKFESLIRWGGIIFAAIIGVGFASFPLLYYFFQ